MATTAIPSETTPRACTWPKTLLATGRVVLGLVFLVAAYTKLHFNGGWHFGDYHFFFAMAIDSYNMLPLWAVELMARVLPILQAAFGALLISCLGLPWVASITSALLLVFLRALTRAFVLHL